MTDTFRDEFSMALAGVHPVCGNHVEAGGLSLDHKKIAVECSMNLLIDMIVRLPTSERDRALITVTRMLPSYVATAVAERENPS